MDSSSSFQLISEKLVKPFSPTQPSLINYKLSLMDQTFHKIFIPVALFYPKRQDDDDQYNLHNTSQTSPNLLEESLSKTLSYYYPFAGRSTDNISVNCNDTGVTFLEVQIKSLMSEILNETEAGAGASGQDIIFPRGLPWKFAHEQPSLMVVQLTHFGCGGKALSLCLRHNIGDAHTLYSFIKDWAAITLQSTETPSPQFIGSSILPQGDLSTTAAIWNFQKHQDSITKTYIFDSKALMQLKAKATAESQVQKPSRVEVLSALLYKCAMFASMVCSGSFKPSFLNSALNLRPLIGPPVTQDYVGNLVSIFRVLTTNEREINFSRLVSEIRRQKIQHCEKYKGMTGNELLSDTLDQIGQTENIEDGMDFYGCTSWCRLPTQNLDFGWGNPIRMRSASSTGHNFFILTDIPNGGGIEAMITLDEQVMLLFQSDPEILAFASSPSV